jgi:hypothetical protein
VDLISLFLKTYGFRSGCGGSWAPQSLTSVTPGCFVEAGIAPSLATTRAQILYWLRAPAMATEMTFAPAVVEAL